LFPHEIEKNHDQQQKQKSGDPLGMLPERRFMITGKNDIS